MLEERSRPKPRRSHKPPFPRILCAIDGTEASLAAIDQALAVADGDAELRFVTAWSGKGSFEHAAVADERARELAARAAERAREAGVTATVHHDSARPLGEAVLPELAWHDLVVVGAHPHGRATGIVFSEPATQLVHRSPLPVLVARERPLAAGVVAATRAVPADRIALNAGAHLAARLGAELTVVHVRERDDEERHAELQAELANARALLGRRLDYVSEDGSPARAIVAVAEGDGAGLVVVGSEGKQGLPALRSVSERVAHQAPCSVLVMREG